MRNAKRCRGQAMMEYVSVLTVVLVALLVILNNGFRTAIDKLFKNSADAVGTVADDLAKQGKGG